MCVCEYVCVPMRVCECMYMRVYVSVCMCEKMAFLSLGCETGLGGRVFVNTVVSLLSPQCQNSADDLLSLASHTSRRTRVRGSQAC